jgi:protein gp37
LKWLVIGGESGPGAREFRLEWARSIREQCAAARVPLFFKQGGSRPTLDGAPYPIRDRGGKDLSEFPKDIQIQDFPS